MVSVGYVLSKEALRLFVQDALPNAEKCQTGVEGSEDANMGKPPNLYLIFLSVQTVDSKILS